jgi:ATP-dependent phosphofructokinase / diphosphate-dependent phosphofructokinase
MASRIGILTGGGDCPGLNAVIRAVVRRGIDAHNLSVWGFHNGWQGVLDGHVDPLDFGSTRGILHRGGTILGTSRTDPFREDDGVQRIRDALDVHELDGLIVIGGEGTLSAATRLWQDEGIPIVGVPKTIDNDLGGTDATIGFATALAVATEAVDRLHSTAESHNRVMLLEVMGRHSGWIALESGMAGGAHGICLPERPFQVDDLCKMVEERFARGKKFAVICVAEGASPAEGSMPYQRGEIDQYGHERFTGIGNQLAIELEHLLGYEARPVILGHVQRGGTPTAYDRVLATRFGWHAVEAAHRGEFGQMTALRGTEIVMAQLFDATAVLKRVPQQRMDETEAVF